MSRKYDLSRERLGELVSSMTAKLETLIIKKFRLSYPPETGQQAWTQKIDKILLFTIRSLEYFTDLNVDLRLEKNLRAILGSLRQLTGQLQTYYTRIFASLSPLCPKNQTNMPVFIWDIWSNFEFFLCIQTLVQKVNLGLQYLLPQKFDGQRSKIQIPVLESRSNVSLLDSSSRRNSGFFFNDLDSAS